MEYQQAARAEVKSHSVEMKNRQELSLSGVEDVIGFDENLVLLKSSMGTLSIRGEGLHIERIDLDSGQLQLKGKVQELSYDEAPLHTSLWQRLFG